MLQRIKYFFLTLIIILNISDVWAQKDMHYGTMIFDGRIYKTMIIGKDTLIMADLDPINISSRRDFTDEEYALYRRYRIHAAKAYPYAKDAINILNTLEARTKDMKPSARRKYVNNTYRQLEHNFKRHLKQLSRTQGRIMIKMIEKETGLAFYDIIKDKRNVLSAIYWHNLGKLYGYDLKVGYIKGDDRVLDVVLQDFYFKKEDSPIWNSQIESFNQKP